MQRYRLWASPDVAATELASAYARIRAELDLPAQFPESVLTEAQSCGGARAPGADFTDLPFWTIDPPSARDLDQAMYLERSGAGFVVWYAIADVAAFVRPGGAIDAQAWKRVQTCYLPDGNVPLHPPQLSEDAASLLPGVSRPAYVWRIALDSAGVRTGVELRRGLVRSRYRTDYRSAQADVDAGRADEQVLILRDIGRLRAEQEAVRGGASLRIPEQEVVVAPEGNYALRLRPPMDAEDWNAQISLLTGMAAADVMVQARHGILRTLPTPDEQEVAEFFDSARALGVAVDAAATYGGVLRSLDPDDPAHLALMFASRRLFRGAGYSPMRGEVPEVTVQAAVGAPYAHTTAPLRRLVDRYVLAACHAILHGQDVPDWADERLDDLPETMSVGDRRANTADRLSVDVTEAAVLSHHQHSKTGEVFEGVVVGARAESMVVQFMAVPVVARCPGAAALGTRVRVVVRGVDLPAGQVHLERVE